MHAITIVRKRSHEFEEEMWRGKNEGLEGGKGKEKYCNQNTFTKINKKVFRFVDKYQSSGSFLEDKRERASMLERLIWSVCVCVNVSVCALYVWE